MCNLTGEANSRVFLNVDETDVEQYLTRHPEVFSDLVNRHQDIIANGHAIQANRQQTNHLEEQQNHLEQQSNHIQHGIINDLSDDHGGDDNDEEDDDDEDADIYDLPRFHLRLRVNRAGIHFTPHDRDENDDSDDSSDSSDAFEIPHIGVGLRVNSHTILISGLPDTDDEFNDG